MDDLVMARRGGGLGAHSTAIEVSRRIEADQDTVELARAAPELIYPVVVWSI